YHHLFVYSNQKLFTHELLNEYTYRYSRLQTTFHGFWHCLRAVYKATEESDSIRFRSSSSSSSFSSSAASSTSDASSFSSIPFVSPSTFAAAWFGFINLQRWNYRFSCSICGPNPEIVLADGITLSLLR